MSSIISRPLWDVFRIFTAPSIRRKRPRQSSPSQNKFSSISKFRSTARDARLSSSLVSSAVKSGIRLSSSILFTVSHVTRTYNRNRRYAFPRPHPALRFRGLGSRLLPVCRLVRRRQGTRAHAGARSESQARGVAKGPEGDQGAWLQ